MSNDEYDFSIKSSKFAHSDGKLDICLSLTSPQQKNSSWSALKSSEVATASSTFNRETNHLLDELMTMTMERETHEFNESCPGFFGSITREQAEQYLKGNDVERGDFLIRNSQRQVNSVLNEEFSL